MSILTVPADLRLHNLDPHNDPTAQVLVPCEWQAAVSCVEVKFDVDIRPQLASYMWDHMLTRPDMPGIYGLGIKRAGFQIFWSDASGLISSPVLQWRSAHTHLLEYVYSLYVPPRGHFTIDPSIRLENPKSSEPPTWTVTFDEEKFEKCRTIFCAPSWGRRTFVWRGRYNGKSVIIKDAYRDEARRFAEGQLITQIHADGIIPGVVRILKWGFLYVGSQAISTAKRSVPGTAPYRRKTRMVLGSVGRGLSVSKTVVDLLMAFYDAIEGKYYP